MKKKRKHMRYYCQTPVMIYPEKQPEKYCYGLTYNYSAGGMNIKSDGILDLNMTYIIKMLNYSPEAQGPELYKNYEGYVRWSKKDELYNYDEKSYYYSYGISYSHPVIY